MKSFINNHLSKMKIYDIAIIIVLLIAIIISFYFLGRNRGYDSKYVSKVFEGRKAQFEEFNSAKSTYNQNLYAQNSLKSEIAELKRELNLISDFESKQEEHASEIQEFAAQTDTLLLQKAEKEKILNDIEYELSQIDK